MKIQVRSPWFDDMDFRLHNFSIEQDDRAEIMEIERAGYEIVSALTGQAPMGMQGMNGMPVNNGMNYGICLLYTSCVMRRSGHAGSSRNNRWFCQRPYLYGGYGRCAE